MRIPCLTFCDRRTTSAMANAAKCHARTTPFSPLPLWALVTTHLVPGLCLRCVQHAPSSKTAPCEVNSSQKIAAPNGARFDSPGQAKRRPGLTNKRFAKPHRGEIPLSRDPSIPYGESRPAGPSDICSFRPRAAPWATESRPVWGCYGTPSRQIVDSCVDTNAPRGGGVRGRGSTQHDIIQSTDYEFGAMGVKPDV